MNDTERITIYQQQIEVEGIKFVQSILQICSIEMADAGVYTCLAENVAGNDTASFELEVLCELYLIANIPGFCSLADQAIVISSLYLEPLYIFLNGTCKLR